MKDAIGDRMKSMYENRTRIFLPCRAYTIIRCDGKSFSNYTKGLKRPFDDGLIEDMDLTAAYLCKNIMGAKIAYVQSDEISILLTDFEEYTTQAWFDNNIQKMVSVSASMATRAFNEARLKRLQKALMTINEGMKWAEFDSRVFQIPTKSEVQNYFLWRQKDCTRNSISSVAQSLYSHKQLHGKNSDQLQELIFQKGTNWNDFKPRYKRGRMIIKESYTKEPEPYGAGIQVATATPAIRTRWVAVDVPIFTQETEFLNSLIPVNE